MPKVIDRNVFAREDIVREVVRVGVLRTCDWCGRKRYKNGTPIQSLFRYGVHPDAIGSRIRWIEGLFCSKGCCDSYHGK